MLSDQCESSAGRYYDHLIAFHRHMAATGFIRPTHAAMLIARDTLPGLLDAMERHESPEPLIGEALHRRD